MRGYGRADDGKKERRMTYLCIRWARLLPDQQQVTLSIHQHLLLEASTWRRPETRVQRRIQ